jgi:hypothetical protein
MRVSRAHRCHYGVLMNHPRALSLIACRYAILAMSLTGCATPLRRPPLLIPMPSSQFLLTPPPERKAPRIEVHEAL